MPTNTELKSKKLSNEQIPNDKLKYIHDMLLNILKHDDYGVTGIKITHEINNETNRVNIEVDELVAIHIKSVDELSKLVDNVKRLRAENKKNFQPLYKKLTETGKPTNEDKSTKT